jgi:hypothetical protein
MAKGICTNATGERLLVYGDKSPQTPQDKDNALYILPPGRKSPPLFDCDGFYVPKGRDVVRTVLADKPGPVAVKVGLQVVDVAFRVTREDHKYKLDIPDQGVFMPSAVCCPSNFPSCVCWNIPALEPDQFAGFPELAGHLPAIDGKWESIDTDHRFLFDIAADNVTWIERGTPSTTPGATFAVTVRQVFEMGRFRIERPNNREVLTFLGFQPASLRDAILARNPKPSFMTFTHLGQQLSAEWNGLVVIKNPNGTLKDVVQPGVRPAKSFVLNLV